MGHLSQTVKPTGFNTSAKKVLLKRKLNLITDCKNQLDCKISSKLNNPLIDGNNTKLTVLLVEDDPIIQRVHSTMLKKMGFNVEIAADGYQAINLSSKHYDIILMDIGLPDMDGITTSLTIRQQRENNSSTPIIALTAYGDEVKQECLSVGINEVATKPIKQEELNELLVKWIKI